MGLIMRAHGISCDNLRSIEIVTADGMVRTANQSEHPELLWAARGGGRGLGVVTSFEFDLHPLGPEVASAGYIYPYEEATQVLRAFCDAAPGFPDTVTPELMFFTIPPIPDFPEELHGARVVIASGVFAGPAEEGMSVLAPLGELGTPIGDMNGIVPYVELQSAFDGIFPDGGRYYMKSHMMDEVTDGAIDVLLAEDAKAREDVDMLVVLRTLGGAIGRVTSDESAYAHRSAVFNLSFDTAWTDPARDTEGIGWARETWDAMLPFANGGVYVNFSGLGDEAAGLRKAVLGSSEQRLNDIRASYDSDGLFDAAAYRP
jgi:FAD/FMN-containing dehydrogenase